jgi:hypothetical protein
MGMVKNALIAISDAIQAGQWAKALDLANEFGDEAQLALWQAVAMLSDTTE